MQELVVIQKIQRHHDRSIVKENFKAKHTKLVFNSSGAGTGIYNLSCHANGIDLRLYLNRLRSKWSSKQSSKRKLKRMQDISRSNGTIENDMLLRFTFSFLGCDIDDSDVSQ